MEFRILGPLEVSKEGAAISLGGPKQRAVLAVLLLHRGEVLSTERLIDELWGESPPPTAAKSVQVYVSQLRKALGDGMLETHGRGYLLRTEPGQVDVERFAGLLERGRNQLESGEAREAADTLREALQLWRGPPLSDLAYESFIRSEIARLDELRLAALEERIEAELRLGGQAELVSELESLVRDHPLRERFRGQLMLSLYRAGRQAEALDAYQEGRTFLVEELGLEPGPGLRELERAILNHDPQLEASARAPRHPGLRRLLSGPRQRVLIVVAGALLLAAAVAVPIWLARDRGATGPVAVAPNSIAVIDPRTNRIVDDVAVGNAPSSIAVGEGAAWVINADDHTISKIDLQNLEVVKTFSTAAEPTDLAVGDGSVWVGDGVPAAASEFFGTLVPVALSRIEPGSAVTTERIRLLRGGTGGVHLIGRWPGERQIAVGADGVWAVDGNGILWRLDPGTGRVVASIEAMGARSLVADNQGLWVVTEDGVSRIDPDSNTVAEKVPLATSGLTGVTTGAGAVWVTDPFAGTLWRIDQRPEPVTKSIAVGPGAWSVAFGGGAVWVANTLDGTLLRIDPATNRVVSRTPLRGTPREVAVGGGRVLVSMGTGTSSTRAVLTATGSAAAEGIPSSSCGPVIYGGDGTPDVLIASDLPLQGATRGTTFPMTQAIQFALARSQFRAGPYSIGYQSCDHSTVQAGAWDPEKCIANAGAFARARKLIGVIGTWHSGCAGLELPILNRAPGGPVAMVSPANSWPGLTRRVPEGLRGEPEFFYPTGIRNYARVSSSDDYQGAAHAMLARDLGLDRFFVLRGMQGSPWPELVSNSFERAAQRLGIRIVGSATWDADAPSYDPLVAMVRRTDPDAVFLAGAVFDRAGPLVKDLRAVLGPEVQFFAPDGFAVIPYLRQAAGPAADGMYVSVLGTPNSSLGPGGRQFLAEFAPTQPGGVVPSFTATYGAQAVEVLLQAIARSDGTRTSIVRELHEVRIQDGILGTFEIDEYGDPTLQPITILRVTGREDPSPTLLEDHVGTVIDRVITAPAHLVQP
jgi:DNA-binding SARP family transcriptional activator/ABC-type branched-subunit amino acid transport system substrate-binding protein/DNA-binding beta-propeller fold protein YncE